MPYTIYCILIGETRPFTVTLDEAQKVPELKKAVKGESRQLALFDAHHLQLYLINVDASKEHWIAEVNLIAQNLSGLQELDSFDSMTQVFGSSSPRDRTVHVLIRPPNGGSRKREELDTMLMLHSPQTRTLTNSLARPYIETVQTRGRNHRV